MHKRYDAKVFPPVPESVHVKLETALKEIEQMDKRDIKKPAAAIATAIVMMVLVLGVALAASRYNLTEYLFGAQRDDVPTDITELIRPLSVSEEADNIRVTIDDVMIDGNTIHLTYEIRNLDPTRPAVVDQYDFKANGQDVNVENDFIEGYWTMNMNDVTKGKLDPYVISGGLTGYVEEPLSGDVLIQFEIAVSRPNGPLVMMGYEAQCAEALDYDDQTKAKMLEVKTQIAAQDDVNVRAALWREKGYTVIDQYGWFMSEEGFTYAWPSRVNRMGQMTQTATVALNFPVYAVAEEKTSLLPENDFCFDGLKVHFTKAELTKTYMEITFQISSDTLEHEQLFYAFEWFTLVDEEGEPLDYIPMEVHGGSEFGGRYISEDEVVSEYSAILPPLRTLPKAIRFKPKADTEMAKAFYETVQLTIPGAPTSDPAQGTNVP